MVRKQFLLHTAATAAAWMIQPFELFSPTRQDSSYPVAIVKEFVGAGHNNLQRVKELLADYPNLIYSRYDWGHGDFEEAIEGAAHVGNREIAEYLIAAGSRPNIFVLAMLGELRTVSSMIDKYPALLQAKGAHGFTLLHHATRGGEQAKELLEYLQSKGLKEMRVKIN